MWRHICTARTVYMYACFPYVRIFQRERERERETHTYMHAQGTGAGTYTQYTHVWMFPFCKHFLERDRGQICGGTYAQHVLYICMHVSLM